MTSKLKVRIEGHSAEVDWNVGLNKSDTFIVWLDEKYLENPNCRLQAALARADNKAFLIARKKGVEIPETLAEGVDVVLVEDWETQNEMFKVTAKLLYRLAELDKKEAVDDGVCD